MKNLLKRVGRFLRELPARVVVILTAAPTYLIAASTAITLFSGKISELFPESAETITKYSAAAVGALATAIVIIRRVTPVIKAMRGILPVETVDTGVHVPALDELAPMLREDLQSYIDEYGWMGVRNALESIKPSAG